jgi:transposase
MIPFPSGVQVWLATGHTDMRRGFDGLALQVQETRKAIGPQPFRVAIDGSARGCGSHGDDHAGTTGIFAGRH